MIRTRMATVKDLPYLVDINKSEVKEWHHVGRHGREQKADYEELTEWERVMHGGPWTDLNALRDYWVFAQKCRVICLVAETDNKVAGHLDVIPTRERELASYLYLDVFIVHRLFRRRGVGTELLKAAESLAIEKGLPKMIVLADYEGPGGLTYRKFGFKASLEMCTLEAVIDDVSMPPGIKILNPPLEPPLDSHHMICGWFNTPSKLWKRSFESSEAELQLDWHRFILSLATKSGILYFLLRPCYPERSVSDVCIWVPPNMRKTDISKAVQSIKTLAQPLGARTLTTVSLEKDREMLEAAGFTWMKEHDPLLSKELPAR